MMKTCTTCRSATLVHRQNLRTLAVMAGVVDVLLRQHVERQQEQPALQPSSW
jgi:stalled ribosome alternative rescue factor ArfA